MYRINAKNACQTQNLNKQPQMCDPNAPWKFIPPPGFKAEVGLNADQLAKVWVDATSDMDGAAALPFDLNEKMISCQTNSDCPIDRQYCLYGFCNKKNKLDSADLITSPGGISSCEASTTVVQGECAHSNVPHPKNCQAGGGKDLNGDPWQVTSPNQATQSIAHCGCCAGHSTECIKPIGGKCKEGTKLAKPSCVNNGKFTGYPKLTKEHVLVCDEGTLNEEGCCLVQNSGCVDPQPDGKCPTGTAMLETDDPCCSARMSYAAAAIGNIGAADMQNRITGEFTDKDWRCNKDGSKGYKKCPYISDKDIQIQPYSAMFLPKNYCDQVNDCKIYEQRPGNYSPQLYKASTCKEPECSRWNEKGELLDKSSLRNDNSSSPIGYDLKFVPRCNLESNPWYSGKYEKYKKGTAIELYNNIPFNDGKTTTKSEISNISISGGKLLINYTTKSTSSVSTSNYLGEVVDQSPCYFGPLPISANGINRTNWSEDYYNGNDPPVAFQNPNNPKWDEKSIAWNDRIIRGFYGWGGPLQHYTNSSLDPTCDQSVEGNPQGYPSKASPLYCSSKPDN